MKYAVIGANGNLGSRVCKEIEARGNQVKAIVYTLQENEHFDDLLEKSLFDLTASDLTDCDVVISAFGGGFKADPKINQEAFFKYIELMKATNKKFVVIGGAGSLKMEDGTFEYEKPGYPPVLKEISKNIKLGIDELFKNAELNWTVVCPSRTFDPEGALTKNYNIKSDGYIMYNNENESYVTYNDLAYAMVEIAEKDLYRAKRITICTNK